MRFALFLAAFLTAGCGRLTPAEVSKGFEELVRKTADGEPDVHGAVLLVDAPKVGVTGTWTGGFADVKGRAFTPEVPFLAASVGKLFTAAAVFVLQERGVWKITDPLSKWVDPAILAGLPVQGGDAAAATITLAQLLSHKSGLPDYFEGKARDGAKNVLELMSAEPDRSWTTAQLLDYTKAHFAPAGVPGNAFLYADTNYDLLGLAVESAAKQPFHEALRTLVLEPIGLRHTWSHAAEPPPEGTGALSQAWIGEYEAVGHASLSMDRAGGGVATTAEDLRVFLRALVAGKFGPWKAYQDAWTNDAISSGLDYAYGLWRVRPEGIFFLLRGLPTLYGAAGATGAFAYYVPEHDAVLVGTFNQTRWAENHLKFVLGEVLPKLGRLEVKAP